MVDPAYVGPCMAREVVESFYKTTARYWQCVGRSLHTDKPSDLERYLHEDVFKVGINPLEHLRGLEIHFYIDKLRAEGDRGRPLSVADMGTSLSSLLQIVRKKGFWLEIRLEMKRIIFNPLHELFQWLRPIIETLETEGGRVAVLFVYRVQKYMDKFEIPLTDLVKASDTEEWKASLKASLLKVSFGPTVLSERTALNDRQYKDRIHEGDGEYHQEVLWNYNPDDYPDDRYYKSTEDERYTEDSDSDVAE